MRTNRLPQPKRLLRTLACAAAALAGLGCLPLQAQPNQPDDSPWRHGVTYEIFVRAFADSDGDGIGDLRGATAKLDYLADLGVRNIWLMPIHPAPSYHKYDVLDYQGVAPEYGTMADLRAFVDGAHQRGMRVILDLVANHVSDRHPWFVSAASDPRSPYRDWFVWRKGYDRSTLRADYDSLREWYAADAVNQQYYALFWSRMPDLNPDHPDVRKMFADVAAFWIREAGVDGYRLDAARHVYDRSWAGQLKSVAFWQAFQRAAAQADPKAYTVGEVWIGTDSIAPYFACFDANFNFPLADLILHTLQAEADTAGLVARLEAMHRKYAAVNPRFIDATFLSNHDQNRVMSMLKGDMRKAKLAAAILLTLPGAPYLYYGEEIGMYGRKPDERIREPFVWDTDSADTYRTHWRKNAVPGGASTVLPVAQQLRQPESILNHYRSLLRLRNTHTALRTGTCTAVTVESPQLLAYIRTQGGEQLLVLHNLSGAPQQFRSATYRLDKALVRFGNPEVLQAARKQVTVPPYSSVILQVR